MPALNTDAFRDAIGELIVRACALGLSALEVRADDLHRRVGGHRDPADRMPPCCNAKHLPVHAGSIKLGPMAH